MNGYVVMMMGLRGAYNPRQGRLSYPYGINIELKPSSHGDRLRIRIVILSLPLPLPPGPMTVIVYLVVRLGETMIEPLIGTSPILGLIKAVSAFVDVHDKVADSPRRIVRGSAEIDTLGRGGITVMVTLSASVPPGPVAVIV